MRSVIGSGSILMSVVLLVVAVLWLLFPLIMLSKFNELLKVSRAQAQLLDRVVFNGYQGKQVLYGFFLLGFFVTAGFALMRNKAMTFTAGLAGALAFALWFNWSHWVDLSHHWTQRDQFWRYFTQRRPDEPIAAFLMNWRGETFYSRNTVKQIKDGNPQEVMRQYGNLPGRKWSLVEHNRLGILKNAVGGDKTVRK